MERVLIKLHGPEDVREFVQVASQCNFDVDVIYNRVIVDGKSLLGVMGLIPNPVFVTAQGESEKLKSVCKKFRVN